MREKDRSLKGKRTARGFTLIEAIIVTVIVAILAAIALPLFASYREKAQIAVAITAIRVIEQTVTSHFIGKGDYPDSLADVGLGTMQDPWGAPYRYFKIFGLGPKATWAARKDRFMVPRKGTAVNLDRFPGAILSGHYPQVRRSRDRRRVPDWYG